MRQVARWAWGLLAITVLLAGCTRLKDEKTVTVAPKSAAGVMEVPAQTSDLKITVTATSSAGPVTLYVAPSSEANGMMTALEAGKPAPQDAVASPAGATPTLEATLSAGKDYTVVAFNAGATETQVKASIVGK